MSVFFFKYDQSVDIIDILHLDQSDHDLTSRGHVAMVMWNQPQLPHIWRFSLGGLFNHNLQVRILVVQQNVSFFYHSRYQHTSCFVN
jgi:hypothetical protein